MYIDFVVIPKLLSLAAILKETDFVLKLHVLASCLETLGSIPGSYLDVFPFC